MTEPTAAVHPADRPPLRPVELVRALDEAGVRRVLTGSTVLALYGADLVPNDLDVAPALDAANLARLGELLRRLGALPSHEPSWANAPSLEECLTWDPDPPSEENLDHLFVTPLGMLDVVPRLCGTYAELAGGARTVVVGGVEVPVCDPAEVLARLRALGRPKDLRRAAAYAAVARRLDGDPRPVGAGPLLARPAGAP